MFQDILSKREWKRKTHTNKLNLFREILQTLEMQKINRSDSGRTMISCIESTIFNGMKLISTTTKQTESEIPILKT